MNESILFEQFVELNTQYPRLRLTQNTSGQFLIKGILEFSAILNDVPLEDEYSIQINIPHVYPESPPTVIECDERIPKDYHTYSDHTLCLGAPVAVKNTFFQMPTLVGFVKNNLIPYLYRYSYKCKFGEYPFGELSHGSFGILEYYMEHFNVTKSEIALNLLKILADNNYRGHQKCPCLSGKTLRNCHGEQLLEIKQLQSSDDFTYEYSEIVKTIKESRQIRQAILEKALQQTKII